MRPIAAREVGGSDALWSGNVTRPNGSDGEGCRTPAANERRAVTGQRREPFTTRSPAGQAATSAFDARGRLIERPSWARYGRSADSGGTPVALRKDAELPGCRRGKAWCSSLHASALFRAFYSDEYALRPDREDIIR